MPRYRMTISYDGTAYAGWQMQPGERTIQSECQRVLKELTGEETRVHSSGRTDAGVHARGQVVHYDLAGQVDPARIRQGFNALLDEDIRVEDAAEAAPDFHARKSARGKEYRYFIWNGAHPPPALRNYRAHWQKPLDLPAMLDAAGRLQGRHDFAGFAANPNIKIDSTTRTVYAVSISKCDEEILLSVSGDGFLYKMVRSLSGFLIRVGAGELRPEAATEILATATRTAAVPTAPAKGLFLWQVWYDGHPALSEALPGPDDGAGDR